MPRLTSNILRVARVTSIKTDFINHRSILICRVISIKISFINHCSILVYRTIIQEGNVNTILKTLSKTFCRHFETFNKFSATLLELVEFICL